MGATATTRNGSGDRESRNGSERPPASVTWPDAERVERFRLEHGGIIYCPVCRRPASSEPIGPVEGIRRLIGHLTESHDELYIGLLRAHLAPPTERPDPYYPRGERW